MRNRRNYLFIIAALPPAIVACYIFLLGLNIPFWDQWDFLSQLLKIQDTGISFEQLISQHNEHRPFFPRIIWIGLAQLTQYNVNAELWINFFFALITLVFFIWQSKKIWSRLDVSPDIWTIPLIVLVVFNLGQWESWLIGFQTIMYLGMLSVVIGFFLLAKQASPLSFYGAIALGFVANYSMANGLFYWICGFFILLQFEDRALRLLRLVAWSIFSLISVTFFFHGWQTKSHLDFSYILTHLDSWGIWILNFLGAPIFTHWHIAWLFGVFGLIFYLVVPLKLSRGQRLIVSPYFAIAIFLILTAFAVSSGRFSEDKPSYSVISRYLTMTSWFWAALIALFPLVEFHYKRWIYIALTASLAALMVGGGWVGYENRYLPVLPAYESAKNNLKIKDTDLGRLYPDQNKTEILLKKLKDQKLSLYAE
ncbi:hypothetical protein [Thiobaca trueperi]|uniref:Glucosyltransferase GtrII-like protein n=1 Tax=Thiobaca trueperi TaxID=127458 RepID=A0A4R3N2K6_9GAMM|nr:hypothetical protein [Thiobaca trueperi]TCT22186.1 hypothetical protein EDC35_103285 [Thiobaca trueperi]